MKSIYEASVDYGREHQGTVNIEDFEAGANYVLEEIEKTIERAEYYSDMSLKSFFYEDLKYMIQELKK